MYCENLVVGQVLEVRRWLSARSRGDWWHRCRCCWHVRGCCSTWHQQLLQLLQESSELVLRRARGGREANQHRSFHHHAFGNLRLELMIQRFSEELKIREELHTFHFDLEQVAKCFCNAGS